MSHLQAVSGFTIELDLIQRFTKDYSALSMVSNIPYTLLMARNGLI